MIFYLLHTHDSECVAVRIHDYYPKKTVLTFDDMVYVGF